MVVETLVYTAAGTVRCVWCEAEWIGRIEDGHDDPACMMWVIRHEVDDAPLPSVG